MQVCGRRIRELREERGYSLQQLAQKAGISVSYLSEIERSAKRPSLKTLEKVARALNCPQEQLIESGREQGIGLGEKLRIIREKTGKSLSAVAAGAGISVSYLSEIERGNLYPAVDTLKKIAGVLEVPLSYIINTGGSLGQKIRQIREQQGMTQADLAKAAGVSAGLIGQIEHEKVQPSLKTLEKIGMVLNISPCYFIADSFGVEEILNQMSVELRQLLLEPSVQSVLRLVCNCSEAELRFILNFIQLYKRSH